ncbi:SET and MYND domain-containing protein 5 [Mactra antiquata]
MAALLADCVEVRNTDSKKGRGLFAKSHIQKDQVIFKEAPLVSCQFAWNEFYKYTACEHCLRSLEPAEAMARRLTENPCLVLPHPECCGVRQDLIVNCPNCGMIYCSVECYQSAIEKYHKCLCIGSSRDDTDHPINKVIESWRNIHYPPESANIMLLLKMIAMVKQSDDPMPLLNDFSRFVQTTVNEEEQAIHKLLSHQEHLELMRSLVTESMYDDKVKQWFTGDGFRSMFALMGTNQQGIGSSSISVWVKNCEKLPLPGEEKQQLDQFIDQLYEDLEKVSDTFLNCEGVGLYKAQSSCNHSCAPNAEIQFLNENHTLSLVALEDIEPEQEVCISYLDACEIDRSRHTRQKILKENYLFTCNCPKCISQADDEDVTSEDEDDDDDEDMEES